MAARALSVTPTGERGGKTCIEQQSKRGSGEEEEVYAGIRRANRWNKWM